MNTKRFIIIKVYYETISIIIGLVFSLKKSKFDQASKNYIAARSQYHSGSMILANNVKYCLKLTSLGLHLNTSLPITMSLPRQNIQISIILIRSHCETEL